MTTHDSANPHLQSMPSDYLYHFGMGTANDLPSKFSDVRFVVMGGSASRMEMMSYYLKTKLGLDLMKSSPSVEPASTPGIECHMIGSSLSPSSVATSVSTSVGIG